MKGEEGGELATRLAKHGGDKASRHRVGGVERRKEKMEERTSLHRDSHHPLFLLTIVHLHELGEKRVRL